MPLAPRLTLPTSVSRSYVHQRSGQWPAIKASTAGIARSGQVSPVAGRRSSILAPCSSRLLSRRRPGSRHALESLVRWYDAGTWSSFCTDVVVCGSATAVSFLLVLLILSVLSTPSPPTLPTLPTLHARRPPELISTSAAAYLLLSTAIGNISVLTLEIWNLERKWTSARRLVINYYDLQINQSGRVKDT